MSGAFVAIALESLPAPDVVEELDFDSIFEAMYDDLLARDPEYGALMESDPAAKVLEVCAAREVQLRRRINDAARARMPAYAVGVDLDHIAALVGVRRQVIDEGDATAIPPVAPTYEDDARLRRRVLLAWEGWSTAGPVGAYQFHTFSASPNVLDVSVTSPSPGEVVVTVLGADGDGTPDASLLAAVEAVLSAEDVRPLTDHVTVQAATVRPYAVFATLTCYNGPDAEVVRQAAEDAAREYVTTHHRLGHDITLSGLYAALHVSGVQRVTLASPAADLEHGDTEAGYCASLIVTVGGRDV